MVLLIVISGADYQSGLSGVVARQGKLVLDRYGGAD